MARPRSAQAHARVLDAALGLFAARGVDATSMDAIAEASGVSKATIYKHWPDKEALCLEAIAHLMGRDQPPQGFDSGDVRADLVALLGHQPPHSHSDLRSRIIPHLWAHAARNPSFGAAWRNLIFEPARVGIRRLLERGVAQGVLPGNLDPDLALALLLGPMMYAHMTRRSGGSSPENIPGLVVDAFWKAHATAPPPAERPARRSGKLPRSR